MMDPEERDLRIDELRFSYAWNYFSFHARQRTTMFNFFLIAVGIIANAVILALRDYLPLAVPMSLLVVGAVFCFAFFCLDKRNVQLLDMGENILAKLEEDTVFKGLGSVEGLEEIPLGFLHREAVEEKRRKEVGVENPERRYLRWRTGLTGRLFRHGTWIPFIQWLLMVAFLASVVALFLNPQVGQRGAESELTQVTTELREIRSLLEGIGDRLIVIEELAAEATREEPDAPIQP